MASDLTNIALRYVQRRVLLLSLIPLGLLFALTVTLARTYHVREAGLVQEWFRQGDQDMSAGQPGKALEDFRNALSYDPGNEQVQLRLAEALLADNRLTEARSYLVNLWDRSPGSGEINFDLAHVSIETGDLDDAVRYFRASIYGSWDQHPSEQRRKVRLELCEFLLERGRTNDAQAELAALAADIPPDDGALHERTGKLLLTAGQPGKALAEFEAALQTNPRQSQWLEDAGNAAFAAGDYPTALRYLARATRESPSKEDLDLLRTVHDILSGDPLRAGLSDQEQALRSWRAYQQGLTRLQQCVGSGANAQSPQQGSSDLQSLTHDAQSLKQRVNLRSLRSDPGLRSEVMQLVFRVEEATSRACGKPADMDEALLLIGRQHASNNP